MTISLTVILFYHIRFFIRFLSFAQCHNHKLIVNFIVQYLYISEYWFVGVCVYVCVCAIIEYLNSVPWLLLMVYVCIHVFHVYMLKREKFIKLYTWPCWYIRSFVCVFDDKYKIFTIFNKNAVKIQTTQVHLLNIDSGSY